MKELTYQAECLKLSLDIEADDEFSINIYGFSLTVEKLIEEISPIITNGHRSRQSQKLFKLAHENLVEEYQNFISIIKACTSLLLFVLSVSISPQEAAANGHSDFVVFIT